MNQQRGIVGGLQQFASADMTMPDITVSRSPVAWSVSLADGELHPFDMLKMQASLAWACRGYEQAVSLELLQQEVMRNIFNNISVTELAEAQILAATTFIEKDPAYSTVAARLLFKKLFREVTGHSVLEVDAKSWYRSAFVASIKRGIEQEIIAPELAHFDLDMLAQGLLPERDDLFAFMGLKTLYERYFIKIDEVRTELPQIFWMRIAMGLAYSDVNRNEKALEFYYAMSSFRYIPSTPTLLHAGQTHPQLSSCYLNTVSDDLKHIFKCIGDNAQLSKWSGGIGTDWTNVRATGAWIKSIKTESQGVVPFLKIANDTTAAINRSGSRRAASCVYLETWHYDIEDFLDLRRNTGDERRRTHDINTANWIPDLFFKRVLSDGQWSLFSPEEAPELHDLYGKAFEQKYLEYEALGQAKKLEKYKVLPAKDLWRKMLSRLFETGHPWLTFKDACNIRSPQDHAGVIHSSNLCTEITLNTSADETAVCNIGSVNLEKHIIDGKLDEQLLAKTVKTAMRMLDNIIDINFYPTVEAKNSNSRHRPVGLGIMGMQDIFYKLDIPFDAPQALDLADYVMEFVAYHVILTSSQLAAERGTYQSYKGSKWDRGIFPVDTLDILETERGMPVEVDRKGKLDWTPVRESVKKHGMRNSNTMSIAPTATISTIVNCFPSIEPIYKNIYVKANMSGEFTVINHYLVEDLKKLNLWNADMVDQIKYYDGNIQLIAEIPQRLKDKYKEAFEIDPVWLLTLTAARSKWIDQSQSHNIFIKSVSGKLLSDVYMAAWKKGIKTTYYLRTLGASQIEKSTLDAKKFGYTQKREYAAQTPAVEQATPVVVQQEEQETQQQELEMLGNACSIIAGPDCEVCQ